MVGVVDITTEPRVALLTAADINTSADGWTVVGAITEAFVPLAMVNAGFTVVKLALDIVIPMVVSLSMVASTLLNASLTAATLDLVDASFSEAPRGVLVVPLFVAMSALVDPTSIGVSCTLDLLTSIDGSIIAVEMASALAIFAED